LMTSGARERWRVTRVEATRAAMCCPGSVMTGTPAHRASAGRGGE
jgi:hypothetical protein